MSNGKIYISNSEIKDNNGEITGQFVDIDNEVFYKISNADHMPEFFMTIVSDSDHWMFISSKGSLSAGRKDRNNALFPYYTDDKIHDYANKTGSISALIIEKNGRRFLWDPFDNRKPHLYSIGINLYKSIYGNKIIFEEVNHDLGLIFSYGWYNSDKFGFVKKSSLTNIDKSPVTVEILDGIQNILPYGIDYNLQAGYSNLSDAYKKNELVEETNLGLFILSSIPVDRAEPSESLKATTVWTAGLSDSRILLCDRQVNNFRKGMEVTRETDIKASRGAYLVYDKITLDSNNKQEWIITAEINQDSKDVADLNWFLRSTKNPEDLVNEDIRKGTLNLKKIVGSSDGIQLGECKLCYARHFSNTLFNIMRGGVFPDNYTIDSSDLKSYFNSVNRFVAAGNGSWLNELPSKTGYRELIRRAEKSGSPDIIRICLEYLPLTFSRRHGDPSRPWNLFSIETKNEDGSVKLSYQGNWRDIFQNWEALAISFPEFVEGMITRFVNASTADGYNPYRISRDGIDWEAPQADDPWAYIGYWGDHQIIYLQKLLELSSDYHPGRLEELMDSEIFVYANVPYRIKPYSEIKKNPKDTIVFDRGLNNRIESTVASIGADGKFLDDSSGRLYYVNLTEKILVTLLTKVSNFIPGAGIWLNTQRPEWNDANNALVGNGTSMVTLCYLRRFLNYWITKLDNFDLVSVNISEEVMQFFNRVNEFLSEKSVILDTNNISGSDLLAFADNLGSAGEEYRNSFYGSSFSGQRENLSIIALKDFMSLCLKYTDHSIRLNRRVDKLYHAYNLISFTDDSILVRNLYEMLEGQVSVLSSGLLSPADGLEVLDALKSSKLFREDQYSYLLYPDRNLPLFIEKNNIDPDRIKASVLLSTLVDNSNNAIIRKDLYGNFHFNGYIRNVFILDKFLDELPKERYNKLLKAEKEYVINLYEEIFDHKSFTGRSGTFYGYEGLGSIYWHMVSKLLLATQEIFFKSIEEKSEDWLSGRIKDHYYEIKAGIGLYKSPGLYGAFPTDAYSHSPLYQGVKQPGMTGQVKEDFISRIRELGVHVQNGSIVIIPDLLNRDELLQHPETFAYIDINGNNSFLQLQSGEIGFTFCQVPFIYRFGEEDVITIMFHDERELKEPGRTINPGISSSLFGRKGEIELIRISLRN